MNPIFVRLGEPQAPRAVDMPSPEGGYVGAWRRLGGVQVDVYEFDIGDTLRVELAAVDALQIVVDARWVEARVPVNQRMVTVSTQALRWGLRDLWRLHAQGTLPPEETEGLGHALLFSVIEASAEAREWFARECAEFAEFYRESWLHWQWNATVHTYLDGRDRVVRFDADSVEVGACRVWEATGGGEPDAPLLAAVEKQLETMLAHVRALRGVNHDR